MPILRLGKPVKELLNKEINSIFSKYGETLNLDFLNLDKLNSISRIDPSFTDKFIESNPHAKFFDLFKPTEILAYSIACDFDLDNKLQNMLANVLIDKYITGDCPCKDDVIYDSGIISSILILNLYGYLIQDNNQDSNCFFYPIVDSAEAILIHNFYGNVLQGEPFNLKELDPIRNPLAFLLILCDGIQDANMQAYGIRDRSIKNDLDILVNDDYFDVLYIVKIASTTLGFYESIKDLLEKRLLISEIFAKGLQISYDINANEEIDFEETVQNEISFGNVESLALSLYQHYVDEIRMDYDQQKGTGYIDERTEKLYHDLVPFNELPSGLKIQYIRQAKSIPKKLNSVGFEIVELSDKREAIDALTPAEVNEMAILEHKRWCDEKFALGWAYGDVRDNEKLVHDCLVPWEMLPFEMQQFDINSARNIPNVVHSAGLKIVSGKLRMLAIELYGYYQKDYGTNQDLFSDVMQLDEAVRDSYYKKSLSIVKILRNIGLDVVDADDSRVPFNLELQHIEYLAKNEYNNEYFEKINLGWQYGPVKDDARRISPSMVHWDKLDKRIQNDNMKMIEHLPEMCDNVGLKIVERH